MKRLRYILATLLMLLSYSVMAQNSLRSTYPVQVMATVNTTSCDLSDYADGTSVPMMVSINCLDPNISNLRTTLCLRIKCRNNVVINSNAGYREPLILSYGSPIVLTQADLEPYFLRQNISITGSLINGLLPEGFTTFEFYLKEMTSGTVVSTTGVAMANLSLQMEPKLVSPQNKSGINISTTTPAFSWNWMPKMGTTGEGFSYKFILKDITNLSGSLNSKFNYAQTVYSEEFPFSVQNFFYDISRPPLEANRSYAWCIQVVDEKNPTQNLGTLREFRNGGLSDIFTFKTTENCEAPNGITHHTERDNLIIEWETSPKHTGYEIHIRGIDTPNKDWNVVSTTHSPYTFTDMIKGKTFEYKVLPVCNGVAATNGISKEAKIPLVDTAWQKRCGVDPQIRITNHEPLPYLKVGDVIYGGVGTYTVTECTGSNGVFSGKCVGNIPILIPNKLIEFKFENIHLNTDYHLFGDGKIESTYDPTLKNIHDLDYVTEGGKDNTVKAKTKVDYYLNVTLPQPPPTVEYDSTKHVLNFYDETGNLICSQELNNTEQSNTFPVVVKDADDNIYQIEETETTDENGQKTKSYQMIPLGKQVADFYPEMFPTQLSRLGRIDFSAAQNYPYSFDEYKEYYQKSTILYYLHSINDEKRYTKLADNYYAPWVFAKEGEAIHLKAKLTITNDKGDILPERIYFITQDKVQAEAKYDAETQTFDVTLPSGQNNSRQILYAVHRLHDTAIIETLGRVDIDTKNEISAKVVLVKVDGEYSKTTIESELNKLSKQVALRWQVEEITDFEADRSLVNNLFEKSSGLLESYNDTQKSLNAALKSHLGGKYDAEACYVFMLDKAPNKSRNVIGFMPRGEQFGYVYAGSCTNLSQTLLHELLHGRFLLRHTFDNHFSKDYSEGNDPENIMDYDNGTHLAQWQWRSIHDPAVVKGLFKKDEDGEALVSLLISYGVNATINASMQMLFAYMFDDNVNSWDEAWDEVSMWQALSDGAIDLIPTKKVRYALSFANDFCQCLVQEDKITSKSFVKCGLLGLVDIVASEAMDKYGMPALKKGLAKIGLDENKIASIFKNIDAEDLPASAISGIDKNITKSNAEIIAKKATFNWAAAIGRNINDLVQPPTGYQFYHHNGKKYIRRLNASDIETPQLTVREGKIVRYDGKTITAFTTEQIASIVKSATKNPNCNKVMLGRYNHNLNEVSYNRAAGQEYTFYELDNWDELKDLVDGNDTEMWRLNKKFIEEQFSRGKIFYFSHNPINPKGDSFPKEIQLLKDLVLKKYNKATIFIKDGELWRLSW